MEKKDGMLETYHFDQKAVIKVNKDKTDIEVLGWNSPYKNNDAQSIDDVKYFVVKKELVDITKLDPDKKYNINFTIKFLENSDGTFDQPAAIFKSIEEVK